MKYSKIIENDVVNGEGVCVSLFVQGCPHRCKGCFNSETWDFEEGRYTYNTDFKVKLHRLINKNGIIRNLSILGGEPLCKENRNDVYSIIRYIRTRQLINNIKIFLWTGYTIEELIKENIPSLIYILKNIDYLIDGPYIESERDITLKWRGSRNQRILTNQEICDIINSNKDKKEKNHMADVSMGTLYDANKAIMQNMEPLDMQELLEQWIHIEDFVQDNDFKYYMLLNREKYDFTLFSIRDKEKNTLIDTYKDLDECLRNRGGILSIERKDNAFEIWLKNNDTKEAFVYYFFPYDNGVIEHGKEV